MRTRPFFSLPFISPWLVAALLAVPWLAPPPAHAADAPSVSVLSLESSVGEQAEADEVTGVLLELLAVADSVRLVDRTDVTMGDLALIYGCELDNLECMQSVAADFATEQLLYGKVEPFGSDLTVKLNVYDSARQVVRPVYSRRIPRAELRDVLRSDIGDLLFGTLWELPGYLTLTTAGAVPGADVSIDARPYGQAPLTRVRVDAGEHVVHVRARGYEPWQQRVVVEGGVALELSAELVPLGGAVAAVATPTPVEPPKPEPPPQMPPATADDALDAPTVYHAPEAAWAALGVGGAALIAATVTGVLALEAESDYQNELRQRQSADLREQGESLAVATNALIGVGLGSLAISAALFAFLGEWQPVAGADLALGAAPRSEGGASLELRFGF